jgi:hypothetical protein
VPWSETVPFWKFSKSVKAKLVKSVKNRQIPWHTSPCSETMGPIGTNDTPFDAPWSETVPFWKFSRSVKAKLVKSVKNRQIPWHTSPCSETMGPIGTNDTPFDAPWSETVPF